MTLRMIGATSFAVGITAVLFWTMTALISQEEVSIDASVGPTVELVNVRRAAPPQPKVRRPPQRPPIPQQPTDPKIVRVTHDGPGIGHFPKGREVDPYDVGERALSLVHADSEAVPMVRVPPDYPTRALARGIEGRVLVEFTITRSGAVRDARVVAAEPSSIFNVSALRAVEQWRYTPQVVNGVAIERRGVRISIPFRRDGDDRI